MSDDDRLDDLLSRWEELYEQGQDVPAEEFCREWPELAGELAARIGAMKRMAWLNERQAAGGEQGDGAGDSGRQAAEASRRPGERVRLLGAESEGPYRLEKWLGRGGFGEVWSAQCPEDESWAVKLIVGEFSLEYESAMRVSDIKHPFLLALRACGFAESGEDGSYCAMIVSELAGGTAGQVVDGMFGDSPAGGREQFVLLKMLGVAEALDYLQNEHGFSHHDVKPSNILVVGEDWKVGDFGTVVRVRRPRGGAGGGGLIVRAGAGTTYHDRIDEVPWERIDSRTAAAITSGGVFTARYAPPEAFDGEFHATFDQYSLALTLCELMCGGWPFAGRFDLGRVRRRKEEIRLGFMKEDCRHVFARALSPDPGERFPSCWAFVTALGVAVGVASERLSRRPSEGFASPWCYAREAAERYGVDSFVIRIKPSFVVDPRQQHVTDCLGFEAAVAFLTVNERRPFECEILLCCGDVPVLVSSPSWQSGSQGWVEWLEQECRRWTGVSLDVAKAHEMTAALTQAEQARAGKAQAYVQRGEVFCHLGRYEEAVENLTQAIDLKSENAPAYLQRGVAYTKLGQFARAVEDFTCVIRLEAVSPLPNDSEAYVRRGFAYNAMGRHDRAIEDLTHAIKLNPKDYESYQERGLAFIWVGQFNQAIRDCTESIRLNPDNHVAYRHRGFAYLRLGMISLLPISTGRFAAADFNRAIRLNPQDWEAHQLLASLTPNRWRLP